MNPEHINPDHIRKLAALLYQVFVETESVPMQATPAWPDLPDLTRQRWVQMATVLWDRLEVFGIGSCSSPQFRELSPEALDEPEPCFGVGNIEE